MRQKIYYIGREIAQMNHLQENQRVWVELGKYLQSPTGMRTCEEWAYKAYLKNNWFTTENATLALQNIANCFLSEAELTQWIANYPDLQKVIPKKIGLIMAGNIPAVGFHDLFCVLISGHTAIVKCSSQDFVLINEIIKLLIDIKPDFSERIILTDRMNDVDALIATGSNNSSRYFDYYFAKKPHIIRKNRTSLCILNGEETTEDFLNLGHDILTYFGLGCRNVSKIFVPQGYDFKKMLDSIEPLGDVILNHKYKNNYDYNKSIYLVNRNPFLDNGFLLLKPDEGTASPISVVFYETFENQQNLEQTIQSLNNTTQCIVSKGAWFPGSIPFGQTQQPHLGDYADGVDTMQFLLSL